MPQLSLDIGTPSKYDFAARNPAIEAARMKAIDATYQLQHMLLGPQEHLFSLGVRSTGSDRSCNASAN